ncbi:MAG: CstA-like transporter-associated (seleno)protein [Terriglobia bacterium]
MENDKREMTGRNLVSAIRHLSSRVWGFLREASGETAYERYAKKARGSCASGSPDGKDSVLSPDEFHRQQLEEKYSKPNRCC